MKMKILLSILLNMLLINCNNQQKLNSNTITQIDNNLESKRDTSSKESFSLVYKTYYPLRYNEDGKKTILIDTLSYFKIKGNILIDRTTMDFYIFKINDIKINDTLISIMCNEVADGDQNDNNTDDFRSVKDFFGYEENVIKMYIKKSNNYNIISWDTLPTSDKMGREDFLIEKEKIKDSGLKYYTYEDE